MIKKNFYSLNIPFDGIQNFN